MTTPNKEAGLEGSPISIAPSWDNSGNGGAYVCSAALFVDDVKCEGVLTTAASYDDPIMTLTCGTSGSKLDAANPNHKDGGGYTVKLVITYSVSADTCAKAQIISMTKTFDVSLGWHWEFFHSRLSSAYIYIFTYRYISRLYNARD